MKVCSTQGQATAGWGNLFLQILCHFCGRLLRLFTPWSHARSISPVCLEPTILRGGVAEGRRIVAATFDPQGLGMPDAVPPLLPCPPSFASPLALHARTHACTLIDDLCLRLAHAADKWTCVKDLVENLY